MEDWKTDLLCELLNCTPGQLDVLRDRRYNIRDLMNGDTTISLEWVIDEVIGRMKCDIEYEISHMLFVFENTGNDLTTNELEAWADIDGLEPWRDIQGGLRSRSAHVRFVANEAIYRKYFAEIIDVFENETNICFL